MTDAILLLAVLLLAAIIGFGQGMNLEEGTSERQLDNIIGSHVEQYVCSNKGCSFFVVLPDQTCMWLWQPKLVQPGVE